MGDTEMRRAIAAMLGVGGLLLGVSSAGAESYRIVDGRLEHAETGASEPLEGRLEISLFEPAGQAVPPSLRVDDFELRAGSLAFGPRQPVEFEDYPVVLFIQLADQIQFDGDDVGFWYLRSGGDWVAADESEVVFRFADFRADGPNPGELVGHVGDGPLPRRLTLTGTLYEVDQHFLIPTYDCPVFPLPPRDGGGVIIDGGGGIIETVIIDGGVLERDPLDIGAGELPVLQPPEPGRTATPVSGGAGVTIAGSLRVGGSGALLAPAGTSFQSASAPTPTLAELGITARSGAEVSFDAAGALSVIGTGDLIVAGGTIDFAGLTSLSLETSGRITIEGTLELPSGVTLHLEAGEVVIEDDLPEAGDGRLDPPLVPLPFCGALRATFPPEERALARVTWVASAARPVGIEVEPRRGGRLRPGRHGFVEVAILGAEDFDVRDVEERSLRLGPADAEPTRHHGLGRTRRIDVNRDGETDLLVRFDAQEAGIPEGAAELCLWGELRDGGPVEGCGSVAAPLAPKERGRRGRPDEDG